MPRPSKLTPDLQKKIVERLAAGSTIKATCDSVGLGESTYRLWCAIGNACLNNESHDRMPRLIADREAYVAFVAETTRAIADGMITAAVRFREGMNPSESVTITTETVTETKVRTIKGKDGIVEQVPYEATKTVTRKTVSHNPGDWRAAMEYLARRDPENWARQAPQKIEHGNADGKPFEFKHTFDPSTMSDDDLRRIASRRTSES